MSTSICLCRHPSTMISTMISTLCQLLRLLHAPARTILFTATTQVRVHGRRKTGFHWQQAIPHIQYTKPSTQAVSWAHRTYGLGMPIRVIQRRYRFCRSYRFCLMKAILYKHYLCNASIHHRRCRCRCRRHHHHLLVSHRRAQLTSRSSCLLCSCLSKISIFS